MNVELAEGYTILPERNGGWFWLAPACAGRQSFISEVIEDRYAVLGFGDVFGSDPCEAARLIFDAWLSGGPTRVRELEGSFSAVIVDRTSGAIVLIGDLMGCRRLSYYSDGRTLIVSPHDVALMATGRCPVEFDYAGVCSVAAFKKSWRGRSLLKQIHTCHPSEYIRWFQGQIEDIADSVFDPDRRIAAGDSKAISRHLDQMIETALANTRLFVANKDEIKTDLSAGFDSRVVFSLLLSVVDDPSQILVRSTGETNSLDVQVARRLAKMYGTRFISDIPIPPDPNDFLAHCDLLAFAMNGATHGKRAMMNPLPKFKRHPKTYASGFGGEMFRGYLYPHKPSESKLDMSPTDALQRLRNRSEIDKLPWSSAEFPNAVLTRLNAFIDECAALSANGYDILDLIGLYSHGEVVAPARRQTWKDPRWSPYSSSKMIRMAFMMPAPIAKYATIHRESLRRFAPRAYWMRINGITLAPIESDSLIGGLLRKVDWRYQKYKKKLQRSKGASYLIQGSDQRTGLERFKAEFMNNYLMEPMRETLMAEGSFALEILGRQGVELLLHEQQSRLKDHHGTLGLLIAMERWRTMVQGVVREAA